MNWLNYHHLLYFWTVAQEGSIVRACGQLHLTQPTISGQLRTLEKSLGGRLFDRVGRRLVLTEMGRVVFRHADEIFSLGRELQAALRDPHTGQTVRLLVGLASTLPRLIVYRLLEPVLRLPEPVRLICKAGNLDDLLGQLAVNALDVVLADAPITPTTNIRAFNHLLGECNVCFMGTPKRADAYRRGFPRSLDGAPMLLPGENSMLRRSLEQWFEAEGIHPVVVGEFSDPALLKIFGEKGAGVFPVRTAVKRETQKLYGVRHIGTVASISERFYAISIERKLKHPAIVAITAAARKTLFV